MFSSNHLLVSDFCSDATGDTGGDATGGTGDDAGSDTGAVILAVEMTLRLSISTLSRGFFIYPDSTFISKLECQASFLQTKPNHPVKISVTSASLYQQAIGSNASSGSIPNLLFMV